MATAFFTSTDGGAALPEAVLETLRSAELLARHGVAPVDLQIMCFAFTDRAIAERLVAAARDNPRLIIRVIADWSQSAPGKGSVLGWMAGQRLANLVVKFKIDAPYVRDAQTGRMVWSYGASLGMLHHKTMLVRHGRAPVALLMGSYNWSARGTRAYENLVLVEAGEATLPVLASFDAEFEALWADHRLTAAPGRASRILERLRSELAQDDRRDDPAFLNDIFGAHGPVLPGGAAPVRPVVAGPRRQVAPDAPVAVFSGQIPGEATARAGFAVANDRRALLLQRPGGGARPAPLTLNTIALQAIRAVPAGARLCLAMYALSPRVPEFGALLEAARRGVRLRLLLDRTIGAGLAAALADLAAREGLALEVRTSGRRMHQKYLLCPDTAMVLTGTANMTRDATLRHADHRVLFPAAPGLARAFERDFATIWDRLAPASAKAPGAQPSQPGAQPALVPA